MATILITGAAQRLGAETARYFHKEGYNVVIHCSGSTRRGQELVDTLNHLRPKSAALVRADLNHPDQINEMAEQAVAAFQEMHILVNNASTFYATPFIDANLTQWQDLMEINLQAPFFLSRALYPELKKNKGSIVNMVDIHGIRPLHEHNIYSMAKSGLIALTKSLALELAPDIRVNAVAPGAILWPEQESSMSDQAKQNILEKVPMKRTGAAIDIAEAVWFLGHQAQYITGQILAVDGGRTLSQ
ncbi:pteridine reductase [Gynuella sp.]|uniref:pteridine reductase n=1 Tax=Gynuella sp. TaxID=2969146 RepID=UPI003D0E106D